MQLTDTQELERAAQALVSRYEQLFITEQNTAPLHDVVHQLKQQLLASEDTSYQGIDFLMRELSHVHDVDVHDVHDAFVDAEGVTPDEWIQSHKSTT